MVSHGLIPIFRPASSEFRGVCGVLEIGSTWRHGHMKLELVMIMVMVMIVVLMMVMMMTN